MSNVQRQRTGPSRRVKSKIDATVVAEIGDLMYQSGDYAYPFSSNSGSTDALEALFLGVLAEGATLGDETEDTDCLVETDGEFDFDLDVAATASWPVGSLVGPASDGAGGFLDQVVTMLESGNAAEAIGKLAQPLAVGDTIARVRIVSKVMQLVSA